MYLWSKSFSDRSTRETGGFSSGEKLPVMQIFCVGLASDYEKFVCDYVQFVSARVTALRKISLTVKDLTVFVVSRENPY